MCRWLGYSGGSIHLDEVIIKPERSIIDQSLHSQLGETTTNGDGFGIGWYDTLGKPGIYKDILPAWNDPNLVSLAEQIKSHLFLAHVRATTGTPIQRTNCHPFQHENWIFVHNGVICDFDLVKRDLMMQVSPRLFPCIQGSTDSEIMFFLAISLGMMDDVKKGVLNMISTIEQVGDKYDIEFPLQMTLGISNGESLFGFRYSSERQSRSLFYSDRIEAMKDLAPRAGRFTNDSRALVSEPVNKIKEVWLPIPESSFIEVLKGEVIIEDLKLD